MPCCSNNSSEFQRIQMKAGTPTEAERMASRVSVLRATIDSVSTAYCAVCASFVFIYYIFGYFKP